MAMLAEQPQHECRVPLSLHAMLASTELPGAPDRDAAARTGERKSFQPYHSQSVPKPENLQATATGRAGDGAPVTTMMLRNIPNKYTQTSLLQEIDDQGFVGSYDFFYLPMDVHNRSNVGYAFINFGLPQDADRFRAKFSDHRFRRFQSRKISSVCTAHVQGLDANLNHFKNRAVTHAKNGQYHPVVLKNNVRVDFEDALAEAWWEPAPAAQQRPPAPVVAAPAPPPGFAGVGQWEDSRLGREGLEHAIRDLTKALTMGKAKQPSPFGYGMPGGGPARPAYVCPRDWLGGSEEKAFSRDLSEGSTRTGFSRAVTEELTIGSPVRLTSF